MWPQKMSKFFLTENSNPNKADSQTSSPPAPSVSDFQSDEGRMIQVTCWNQAKDSVESIQTLRKPHSKLSYGISDFAIASRKAKRQIKVL